MTDTNKRPWTVWRVLGRGIAGMSHAIAASSLCVVFGGLASQWLHAPIAGPVAELARLEPRGAWLVVGLGLPVLVVVLAMLAGLVAGIIALVAGSGPRLGVAVVGVGLIGLMLPWTAMPPVARALVRQHKPRIDHVEAMLPGGSFHVEVRLAESLIWPVSTRARITSGYGWRHHPTLGRRRFHNGVDIAVAEGTPVVAVADGIVDRATFDPLNGHHVVLLHGGGLRTAYCHLSALHVRAGDVIGAGEIVGASGATGRATGPHLHYGAWVDGRSVDPRRLSTL